MRGGNVEFVVESYFIMRNIMAKMIRFGFFFLNLLEFCEMHTEWYWLMYVINVWMFEEHAIARVFVIPTVAYVHAKPQLSIDMHKYWKKYVCSLSSSHSHFFITTFFVVVEYVLFVNYISSCHCSLTEPSLFLEHYSLGNKIHINTIQNTVRTVRIL